MTDRELLQRYKDGDGNAFTDFFNRHVKQVTQWVADLYKLPLSDIDNAVQLAFIGISKREIPDDPVVFLQQAAITNAKCIKRRKKNPSRRGNISFTSIHELDNDDTSITGSRSVSHFIDKTPEPGTERLRDILDRAIESLPPNQKEVVCQIREDDNMSNAVKKLKLHRSTVTRRLDEGIRALKRITA